MIAGGNPCALCASADIGGQIVFREERREPMQQWEHVRVVRTAGLCGACFGWADGLVQRIVTQDPATQMMLGVPNSPGPRAQDGSTCEYCRASLNEQSFSVELAPARFEPTGRSNARRAGQIKQNRICRQCHTWWLTTIEDSSSLKGTSFRALEGANGGWRGDLAYDARSVFISAQDQFVLRTTVEAMGRGFTVVRGRDVTHSPDIGEATVFVGAGRHSRATEQARAASAGVTARTIVVARNDSLEDGLAALRAGAADMLASPLSPQQISGAFQRLAQPAPHTTRDPETGLPVFSGPIADDYLNCYLLEIDHPHVAPVRSYLLLRRFLRGYDRVGLSPSGKAAAQLYCSERHVENVTRRLTFIVGAGAKVRLTGHAAATRPGTHVA